MKILKYIFLIFTFLGLFQTRLEAKTVILENDKIEVFVEQDFTEISAETKWLNLLYLQESTSQYQTSLFQFSFKSLTQNFSGELCSKIYANDSQSGFRSIKKSGSYQGNDGWNEIVFNENLDLVDSWKKFGDSPLRTNTKFIEHINDLSASWKITHNGGVTKILDSNGKELAELSEGLVKTKGGIKANGDWNKLLNKPPMKNQKYRIDDYLFETDELGRVKNVKGELQDIERGRLKSQQTGSVALKDGLQGDEGGHLIANILNGPGEQLNYLPQTQALNQGAWKDMETIWKNAIRKTPTPSKVEVDIRPIFEGASKRPVAFEVGYWIDGVKKSEFFDN